MFFDDFTSKFFGQSKQPKNRLNDSHYYDSNGVIKGFEKVIKTERDVLKILENHNKKYYEEKAKSKLSPEFHLLYERMNSIEYEMQRKVIHLEEDFVYIMKNTVALEKEIISMIENIRNHPKLKGDNKLWKEITDEHLPRLRTLGDIMNKYAEKRRTELEKDT